LGYVIRLHNKSAKQYLDDPSQSVYALHQTALRVELVPER